MRWGLLISAALLWPAAASAAPTKIERNSKALEFSYQWPAEAARIPALVRRLRGEADKALAEARRYAAEDQALTSQQQRKFNQHYYTAAWETAGESPRLLSLEGSIETFTGGAHPNHAVRALLWNRLLGHEIAMATLFSRAADFASLTRENYCKKLDAERLKRRQGEVLEGEFAACPKYGELAIALSDKDKDGRFDTFDLVAPPYVAGPYAEGEYEISLPVTARVIAAIKREYRASFEAQRQ